MTGKRLRILIRIIIIALAVFVWIRPLFYAYHDILIFKLTQYPLVFISLVLLLRISIKLKPLKFNAFIILAFLMISYPIFHKSLCSYSEKIFFDLRQDEMISIVEDVKSSSIDIDDTQFKSIINDLDIHSIMHGDNYYAFLVNGITDNTYGFIYLEKGELPRTLFGGNVVRADLIDGKWYAFGTK